MEFGISEAIFRQAVSYIPANIGLSPSTGRAGSRLAQVDSALRGLRVGTRPIAARADGRSLRRILATGTGACGCF